MHFEKAGQTDKDAGLRNRGQKASKWDPYL